MKVRDAFFQVKRLKDYEHLGTYNEYVKKDSGLVIQSLDERQLLKIYDVWADKTRRHIDSKRGGKVADIAKSLVMSLPPEMESKIDRTNEKQMRAYVDYVLKDFLEGIKQHNPKVDIKWLRRNMSISLHYDTEHTHFHCVVPTHIPTVNMLTNEYTRIDYSKRAISLKTRRSIYNYCQRFLRAPELSEKTFLDLAKKEQSAPKRKSKKQIREDIESELERIIALRVESESELDNVKELSSRIKESNSKWIINITNKLSSLESNLVSGKYDEVKAIKEIERISKHIDKTNDLDLTASLAHNLNSIAEEHIPRFTKSNHNCPTM